MAKCLLHRYDGFDNLTGVGVFSSLFQLFKWILGNDLVDWEPTFFVELNQPWNKDLWIGVAFTTANYGPICHQDVLAKVKVLNFTRRPRHQSERHSQMVQSWPDQRLHRFLRCFLR